MCVGIPMKLVQARGQRGVAIAGGLEVEVGLALVPGAKPGDWLIVHAGFAIELLDEHEARETLELLAELEAAGLEPDRGDCHGEEAPGTRGGGA